MIILIITRYNIMKKLITLFTAVILCMMLTGCGDNAGSSGKTPAEMTSALTTTLNDAASSEGKKLPEMVSVSADTLHDRFLIDEADVSEFSAYICGNGSSPREYGVFVAKDADAANRVSEALLSHVEVHRKTFETYKPDEMYKFDDSFVEINGNTVSYAVCEDNSKAKELLK